MAAGGEIAGAGAHARVAHHAARAAARAAARIAEWRAAEEGRVILWAPVAFGAGAATHLSMRDAPPLVLAGCALAAAIIAFARTRSRLALLAAICAAGFLAAEARVRLAAAPILERETGIVDVDGRIAAIEDGRGQRRILLSLIAVEGVDAKALPLRARVTWRGATLGAGPGDRVRFRARLSPPPPPATPFGFDFARTLYFQRIGAVGFAVSEPRAVEDSSPRASERFRALIERQRRGLAARIVAAAPGDAGAIVAAVVTGKREMISEEANEIFRRSGLAHLLSISGLHMSLATGLVYFLLRAILALAEPVALRAPIKKWAAFGAILAGGLYLAMSGLAVPAQRSFVMSSIFFIAILFDRRALSLRNVALAAMIVLAFTPEAVLHPGFQMSFAAVTALIAYHEWATEERAGAREGEAQSRALSARFRRYVVGIAITDIIASLATSAYGLYHFHQSANFGLPANLVSIPLMGFVVMPAAIAALALTPLGIDAPFWRLAAAGIDPMLDLGAWTSSAPGAVSFLPQWPPAAIAVITLGGLWLCLCRGGWRLAGLAAIPAAGALVAGADAPRFFIADDGENAGFLVKGPDGARLALARPRRDRFAARHWMESAGVDPARALIVPLAEAGACDAEGCVLRMDGATIAVSLSPSGVDDDCLRADFVVALHRMARRARAACAAGLFDGWAARDGQGASGYIAAGTVSIRTVADMRGRRPWSGAPLSISASGRRDDPAR